MMIVKVKTENKIKFTIPLPYTLLQMGGAILSSRLLWKQINKWASHHTEEQIPTLLPINSTITKQQLRKILKEMRRCKGIELVNIKASDGTEVKIRL